MKQNFEEKTKGELETQENYLKEKNRLAIEDEQYNKEQKAILISEYKRLDQVKMQLREQNKVLDQQVDKLELELLAQRKQQNTEIDLKEKEINHEVREQYQLQKIIEPLKKELAGIREVQLELKQATDDQLNAETRYKELLKERDMLQEKIKIQKKQEEENLMQQELEAASPSKKDKKKKKK